MRFLDIVRSDLESSLGNNSLRSFCSGLLYDPGFRVIFGFRCLQHLWLNGWPRFAKFLWCRFSVRTGCHIHLDSAISPGVKFPHPVGIVIGAGVKVGAKCVIYQNVTLGSQGGYGKNYPIIGSSVTLFPSATVVGNVCIDSNSKIGALAFVKSNVSRDVVIGGGSVF